MHMFPINSQIGKRKHLIWEYYERMTLISWEAKGPRRELHYQEWTPPGSSARPAKAGEETCLEAERSWRGDGEEGHLFLIAHLSAGAKRGVKQIELKCGSYSPLFTLRCHFQRARLDCDWRQTSRDSFERQIQPNWLSMYGSTQAVCC